MSELKTLGDFDVVGKKVLLRVAYDFSLKMVDGVLTAPDHARIRTTIPTIEYLLSQGCSIGLVSWLKRPSGKVDENLRLWPVAKKLGDLLGKPVEALSDCVGPEVKARVEALKPGEIIMLENVRFHAEEDAADSVFAKELTDGFDCIVFDAFAQAHRKSASVVGICEYLPVCAGFLMEKEVTQFQKLTEQPDHPFVVVSGGAKISDKVDLLRKFLHTADCILVGGALANTFLKAHGTEIGKSLVEDTSVDADKQSFDPVAEAKQILEEGKGTLSLGDTQVDRIQLPIDMVAAINADSTETVTVNIDKGEQIPEGYMFLDIGPRTIDLYTRAMRGARMIFANGPMGFFEKPSFESGTIKVTEGIIHSGAVSVIGGGDTEKIIAKFGWEQKFSHVSTGGGAALEFLAGKTFPIMKYLTK